MEQRINDLREFLKKVKELRGYGDMNSYKVVKDYNELAQETANDHIDNIITALSSPRTFNDVKTKMISNASHELKEITGGGG